MEMEYESITGHRLVLSQEAYCSHLRSVHCNDDLSYIVNQHGGRTSKEK